MNDPKPVLTLDYDRRQGKAGALRAYIGFLLGLACGAAAQAVIAVGLAAMCDAFAPLSGGMWMIRYAIVTLVPAAMIGGVTLLIRRAAVLDAGFAGLGRAITWGCAAGAFPIILLFLFERDPWFTIVVATMMAWNFFLPIVAGIFLCRRDHLRNPSRMEGGT